MDLMMLSTKGDSKYGGRGEIESCRVFYDVRASVKGCEEPAGFLQKLDMG